ncbi:DUF1830 domain-containing protein [Chroococcidiopsis cubana]|uniref:DUF1830 domain-containing protein n=1 Tax=Chroococcidiopsis cubana TaxID=171392 RepID=UPI002ACE7E7A|nr:DUF1830 domain-containing protein [Chroococcidiopsis cubana]
MTRRYQQRILCQYKNATSSIQIARITNIPHWYLERVVFLGQHLLFEAVKDVQLKIHSAKTVKRYSC